MTCGVFGCGTKQIKGGISLYCLNSFWQRHRGGHRSLHYPFIVNSGRAMMFIILFQYTIILYRYGIYIYIYILSCIAIVYGVIYTYILQFKMFKVIVSTLYHYE